MNAHTRPPEVPPDAIDQWRAQEVGRLEAKGFSRKSAKARVRRLEDKLRQIADLLDREYKTPHLGNWLDPTDEFAFIALSRKTAERAYQPSFEALKRSGSWNQIARSEQAQIEATIYGCGLEGKKSAAILEGLRAIIDRFGAPDLSQAAILSDDELFLFLANLPEIGPKSARCIMMYSFHRLTFPVDTHVGRVLSRLGVFLLIDLELAGKNHKLKQKLLAEAVPPDLRYGLHVNLIMHGRLVCREAVPWCTQCLLLPLCEFGKQRRRAKKSGDT